MEVKYKIYAHKLYSPKDIARRTGIEEEKIIALLEEEKTFGRKMGNFWLIRGSEILKINKIFRERKKSKDGQDSINRRKIGRLDAKKE